MKNNFLCLLAFFISTTLFAQNEKYIAAMQKTLEEMGTGLAANDGTKLQAVAAQFERIGNAEKTEWLPYYYAALTLNNYAFLLNKPNELDAYADKIDAYIGKAEELEPKNSEIVLLKAMNATLRMIVDPMSRFMVYGSLIDQYSKEASALDPTNPRPAMFTGMNLVNTPEQFGGGCKIAKPYLEKAAELFATFQPKSPLHPNWGKEINEGNLAQCK